MDIETWGAHVKVRLAAGAKGSHLELSIISKEVEGCHP